MCNGHFTQGGQYRLHTGKRVVGNVETQHFSFKVELGFLVPFLDIRHGDRGVAHGLRSPIVRIGEQVELTFGLLTLETDH